MKQDELFEAIRGGDEATIRRLLDQDPDLRTAASGGVSPILYACYTGHASLAPTLLQGGPPPSFAEACAIGDEIRARQLLEGDPSLLNEFTPDGFPPLGLAVFFRHPQLAKQLIERGADVHAHAKNAQRVAPLHAAVAVGDHETAALLLERGAEVNARQQGGFTPLHGAASRGDAPMIELLLAARADRSLVTDDGKTAADIAIERGHATLAERLRAT
ncbi:MAG: ankyrin repeat domain-containing protein [Thermoanaerobaculia bacterium]